MWGQKTTFLCHSLPQKTCTQFCHAYHLGRIFFFLLWEAVLELLCWEWGEWEFTPSAGLVGLQSTPSTDLTNSNAVRSSNRFLYSPEAQKIYRLLKFFLERPILLFQADIAFPYLAPVRVWKDCQKENRGEKIWWVDSGMTGPMQWKDSGSTSRTLHFLQTNTFVFVFQKRNAVASLSFHHQQREVRANPHTSLWLPVQLLGMEDL